MEDDRNVKRKRTTLSCQSCQKRKLKCDKTQPCSTCRARGEGERCQYDEGSTPPPQQSFVTVEQFQEQFRTLQAEVENLRRKLGDPPPRSASLGRRNPVSAMPSPISLDNHISPATLSDAGPAQDQSQAAHTHCPAVDVEHAFKQLDTLVEATSGADAICLSSDRFRSSEPITNAPTFGYGGLNLLGDSSAVGTRSAPAWPTIFLAAQTDRTDRWRRDMFEITSLLPSNELMSIMLEFFFKSLWTTPMQHPHEATFRQEVQQFQELGRTNYLSVDPAWLAILTIALGIGVSSWLEEDDVANRALKKGHDVASLQTSMTKLFDAHEIAMACAETYRPQLRVLYASLLKLSLSGRAIINGDKVDMDVSAVRMVRFGTLAGIARALRLHLLGPNSGVKLPSDPMLCPDNPLYSREIASRIFHSLVVYDTFLNCILHGKHAADSIFFFPEGSFSTAEPGNYHDEDLLSGSAKRLSLSVKTPYVLDILRGRVAAHWRKILKLLENPHGIDYQTVLQLDDQLSSDHQHLVDIKTRYQLTEREEVMWYGTNSSYQQRRLRLHRPYLLRSFKDKQYDYSKRSALASAHEIMADHRLLISYRDFRSVTYYSLYLFLHHLSAMNILFAYGMLDPLGRDSVRDEIKQSFDVFSEEMKTPKPPLYAAAIAKAHRVAKILIEVLDNPPPTADFEESMRIVTIKLNAAQHISNENTLDAAGALASIPAGFGDITSGGQHSNPMLPSFDFDFAAAMGGAADETGLGLGLGGNDNLLSFLMPGLADEDNSLGDSWNVKADWASVLESW